MQFRVLAVMGLGMVPVAVSAGAKAEPIFFAIFPKNGPGSFPHHRFREALEVGARESRQLW